MSAHADGVELVLEVRSRSPVVGPMLGPDEGAGSMRFGVELADGRSTESNFPAMDRELTPEDGPILMPRGGGGGGGLYRQEYWLWPLPPAGRTTFAFVWDDAGIPESLTSIDGAVLHLAADEGEQLWEPLTPEEEQAAAHAALRQMSAGRAFRSTGLMFGSGTSKTEE